MFEFAAGQVQQEERERRIAEGLRRRELLVVPEAPARQTREQGRTASVQRRMNAPVRAHAER